MQTSEGGIWARDVQRLRREEPAERSVGLGAQVGEGVRFGDVQSLLAAHVHHRAVDVDAARRDPLVAQDSQELATPAPDVQDVARAGEEREVFGHTLPDVVAGPAKPSSKPTYLWLSQGSSWLRRLPPRCR